MAEECRSNDTLVDKVGNNKKTHDNRPIDEITKDKVRTITTQHKTCTKDEAFDENLDQNHFSGHSRSFDPRQGFAKISLQRCGKDLQGGDSCRETDCKRSQNFDFPSLEKEVNIRIESGGTDQQEECVQISPKTSQNTDMSLNFSKDANNFHSPLAKPQKYSDKCQKKQNCRKCPSLKRPITSIIRKFLANRFQASATMQQRAATNHEEPSTVTSRLAANQNEATVTPRVLAANHTEDIRTKENTKENEEGRKEEVRDEEKHDENELSNEKKRKCDRGVNRRENGSDGKVDCGKGEDDERMLGDERSERGTDDADRKAMKENGNESEQCEKDSRVRISDENKEELSKEEESDDDDERQESDRRTEALNNNNNNNNNNDDDGDSVDTQKIDLQNTNGSQKFVHSKTGRVKLAKNSHERDERRPKEAGKKKTEDTHNHNVITSPSTPTRNLITRQIREKSAKLSPVKIARVSPLKTAKFCSLQACSPFRVAKFYGMNSPNISPAKSQASEEEIAKFVKSGQIYGQEIAKVETCEHKTKEEGEDVSEEEEEEEEGEAKEGNTKTHQEREENRGRNEATEGSTRRGEDEHRIRLKTTPAAANRKHGFIANLKRIANGTTEPFANLKRGKHHPPTPSECLPKIKSSPNVRMRRLMKEYKVLSKNSTKFFSVDLVNDCLDEWMVRLYRVDQDSLLHRDMQELGVTHILLSLSFPENFPFQPPFLRVLSPRLEKGFVMEGGAICMELLTPRGWASAYTIEAIIMQFAASLVKGQGRICRKAKGTSGKEFSKRSAESAFKSLVRTHERYGWVTPPLSEG